MRHGGGSGSRQARTRPVAFLAGRCAPLRRPAVGVLALGLLAGCGTLNIPPLYEMERDLPGAVEEHRSAFGLGLHREYQDGAVLSAVRPLIAHATGADGHEVTEVLPPVLHRRVRDTARTTWVLPIYREDSYGTDADRAEGKSDDDAFILPLFAWGDEPEQGSYFMFFPFGGNLKGKLLEDEIRVGLFPLWAQTRSDDWVGNHVLWPLVAWGEGGGTKRLRVLPFWAQTDTPTSSKRSALWPFVHWNTETLGDRTLDGWFVFPLLGHRAARDGSSEQWSALYPLFQFAHDDRTGSSYRAVLWPLHKRSIQPGVSESTWWWPLYGDYSSESETSSFYAWPIVWLQEETKGNVLAKRTYVVPFWMKSETGPVDGPPTAEALRSWPFFSYRREPNGLETVRVPELIPFFGWETGEAVYSELLSLFHWRSDAEGRVAWDGPLGIIRYRRRGDEATLRLLWWIDIPLGGAE